MSGYNVRHGPEADMSPKTFCRLVHIGVAASWASRKASTTWPWLDRIAQKLPHLSAGIVMILGLVMSAFGFHAAWLATHRKPNWMA